MIGLPQVKGIEVGGDLSLKNVGVMINAGQNYVGGTACHWVAQADGRGEANGGLVGRDPTQTWGEVRY